MWGRDQTETSQEQKVDFHTHPAEPAPHLWHCQPPFPPVFPWNSWERALSEQPGLLGGRSPQPAAKLPWQEKKADPGRELWSSASLQEIPVCCRRGLGNPSFGSNAWGVKNAAQTSKDWLERNWNHFSSCEITWALGVFTISNQMWENLRKSHLLWPCSFPWLLSLLITNICAQRDLSNDPENRMIADAPTLKCF